MKSIFFRGESVVLVVLVVLVMKGVTRERQRGRERTRETFREREGWPCKMPFFLLLALGSPREKFAVIPNLCNKPTTVK